MQANIYDWLLNVACVVAVRVAGVILAQQDYGTNRWQKPSVYADEFYPHSVYGSWVKYWAETIVVVAIKTPRSELMVFIFN